MAVRRSTKRANAERRRLRNARYQVLPLALRTHVRCEVGGAPCGWAPQCAPMHISARPRTSPQAAPDRPMQRAGADRESLRWPISWEAQSLEGQSPLGISVASFRVGGGILILLMAIGMLGAKPSSAHYTPEETEASSGKNSVAVVPLAIPLVAGPGAISTTII